VKNVATLGLQRRLTDSLGGRRSFAEPAPHHVTRRRELHEHSLLRGDMQQALLQERRARGDVIDTRPSEPAPSRSTPRDMRAPLWLDDMRSKRSTSKSAEVPHACRCQPHPSVCARRRMSCGKG
jgi:hypothetical protein